MKNYSELWKIIFWILVGGFGCGLYICKYEKDTFINSIYNIYGISILIIRVR